MYQVQIYSYNLKGRSEVVTLPKITLDAEERFMSYLIFSRFFLNSFATNINLDKEVKSSECILIFRIWLVWERNRLE